MSGEAFDRVLDVNLNGVYRTVIAALPDIREAAQIGGVGVLSNRGLYVLWPYLTATGTPASKLTETVVGVSGA